MEKSLIIQTELLNRLSEVNSPAHQESLLETLKKAGDAFESTEERALRSSGPIATHVMNIFIVSQSIPIQLECIRVISNFVVDNDINRKFVLDNREFVLNLLNLLGDMPTIVIANAALEMLQNLINDYPIGVNRLNSLKTTPAVISKVLGIAYLKPNLNISLLLDLFLKLVSQDEGIEAYPLEALTSLGTIASLKLGANPEDYIVKDARAMLKLLEREKFEDHVMNDEQSLMVTLGLLLALAHFHKDDQRNPDLSRRCLGAIGNFSANPRFCQIVQVSNNNPIFRLVVELFHENYIVSKLLPSGDVEGLMEYSLSCGIACVILGNLATSTENVQNIFRQVPDLIPTAMNYFASENDPFGLQGAHLIKNITIVSNLNNSRDVLQRGGASLVEKLINMTEFSNLRLLGVQIAKNLLSYTSHLGSLEAALDYGSMVRCLNLAFQRDDDEGVKNEIILACDAAIAELLLYEATDGDEEASEFLDAETLLSKLFINFLHLLYISEAEINIIVTLKASKSLGVLSSAPALTHRQRNPNTVISILDHTVRHNSSSAEKLVDILSGFSSRLVKTQPQGRLESNEEAVTKTFKGIINNLGYVGVRMQNSDNKELVKACETAIKNASVF